LAAIRIPLAKRFVSGNRSRSANGECLATPIFLENHHGREQTAHPLTLRELTHVVIMCRRSEAAVY